MDARWLVLVTILTACSARGAHAPPHPAGEGGAGGEGGTEEGGDGTGGAAACDEGATRPCEFKASCGPGIQSCTAGTWAQCAFVAQPDVCNGLDDDCNGVVDDGSRNACGGSCKLEAALGDPCGTSDPCTRGHFVCDGLNALRCELQGGGEVRWVWSAGGRSWDQAQSVAATPDNGAVILGFYSDGIDFGNELFVGKGPALFLARIGPTGKTEWARSIPGGQRGDVAVTAKGEVLLLLEIPVGQEESLAVQGTTATFKATGAGVYIARLNAQGEPELLEQLTADFGTQVEMDVAATSDGGAVVGLGLGSDPELSTGLLSGRKLTTLGVDALVLKLDANLQGQWIRQIQGPDDETGARVTEDGSGGIYALVATRFPPIDVSLGETDQVRLQPNNGVAMIRYSMAGDLTWARWIDRDENVGNVRVDSGGAPIATSTTLQGGTGAFLARSNADGTQSWFNGAEGVTDYSGLPWVAPTRDGGAFFGTGALGIVVVGDGDPEETDLEGSRFNDPLIARFDPGGKVIWAQLAHGSADDYFVDGALASDGDLLVGGTVSSSDLHLGRCGQSVPVSHSWGTDVFVARFGP